MKQLVRYTTWLFWLVFVQLIISILDKRFTYSPECNADVCGASRLLSFHDFWEDRREYCLTLGFRPPTFGKYRRFQINTRYL